LASECERAWKGKRDSETVQNASILESVDRFGKRLKGFGMYRECVDGERKRERAFRKGIRERERGREEDRESALFLRGARMSVEQSRAL
jgi:hypothetical protein